MTSTGKKLQDWTNKHVFTGSVDSWNDEWSHGFRDEPTRDTETNEPKNSTTDNNLPIPGYGSTLENKDQEISNNTANDPHASGEPITSLQAAWNVTNAIQGMFIVGLPIAVKVGGWWSVAAMLYVAYICFWTGILLVDCLYDNNKKIRYSYKEVAEAYRPGFGKIVLAAQMTELLSTCIIYLVMAADLLQACFPSIDKPAWMMLVSAILLGCALLESLVVVSQLSLANAVSHLIINAIMVIYCLSQVSSWVWSEMRYLPSIDTFPTMIGVVVFGYTSHIFLPSLEGNMQKPSEFKSMLMWSHVAAALFKAIFGLMGYLTFGELTQQEISNSLPNQGFKIVINFVLVTKALLSYPLPYYAAVQLLKDNFFKSRRQTIFTSCYSKDTSLREWALVLRIVLVLFTLFVALSVPYLIELMGLIGNITGTMLSFIWPALFHLKLKGQAMVDRDRKFDQFVIGLGCFICITGIYYSTKELMLAVQNGSEQ